MNAVPEPIPADGRVVVVGGGLAATRVISALRRKKLTGPIDLIAAERHLPYDRPPLSKGVLVGDKDATSLPFDPTKLEVSTHLGRTATGIDVTDRIVRTDQGDVRYDGLVIATGAEPITVPGNGRQLTLRTIDDALTLRKRLTPGARVVIIGAGWIGAEVATAATARGCSVTCIEFGQAPLANALGIEVADRLATWWSGVDLRCDTAVREVLDDGVVLTDGSLLPADVVVTGIGVRPAIGWLSGTGPSTDRGVLTDEFCRTDAPGIVAVGDVAQRWSPRAGRHVVTEHWDDAGGAAATAAAALLGDASPYDPVPYFWSDQFGHKIQYVGSHGPDDTVAVTLSDHGVLDTVTWTSPDGALSAWLGVDRPRDLVPARMAVGRSAAEYASV
ncbi:FAD-dependent oxidoreductase [Gordonia hydrophobica]|uniref:FAD-dependent oxidoreductase n=1 Tax=Gordonia hydrophobica TaxID=40516 RepID=A0ABZ2TWG9_9ACTN|nr:FAD-dependent oxidoreductase [Gordonia hydrophobica]MBM7365846.1 NADPH-dependent 2,4-dienoyl-CoA reductase/sulfur reductase-like enzyme [Gordonia hydrophobica]